MRLSCFFFNSRTWRRDCIACACLLLLLLLPSFCLSTIFSSFHRHSRSFFHVSSHFLTHLFFSCNLFRGVSWDASYMYGMVRGAGLASVIAARSPYYLMYFYVNYDPSPSPNGTQLPSRSSLTFLVSAIEIVSFSFFPNILFLRSLLVLVCFVHFSYVQRVVVLILA